MEVLVEREGEDDRLVLLDGPCSGAELVHAVTTRLRLEDADSWELVLGGGSGSGGGGGRGGGRGGGVVVCPDDEEIGEVGGKLRVEARLSEAAVHRRKLRAAGVDHVDMAAFTAAVDAGDVDRAASMLLSKAPELEAAAVGRLLCEAAGNGRTDRIDVLMRTGLVDINTRSGKYTPLLAAAMQGADDACLHILRNHAPNVNARTKREKLTALGIAAERDMLEVFEVLVGMGADVNALSSYGDTPLSLAITGRSERVVAVLLDMAEGEADTRVELNTSNRLGDSPLTIAAEYGLPSLCLSLMARGADIHHVRGDGNTPLTRAAANSLDDVCLALISQGADIHVTTDKGDTPLTLAADGGLEAVCRALVERGADVNHARPDGNTPLTRAIANGLVATSSLLIEHGADVNVTTIKGRHSTPLTLAAEYGLPSLVAELLAAGAEPNVLRLDQKSALFLACECLNAPAGMIRSLLVHGADVRIEVDGETPFTLSAANHLDDVCLAFVEVGGAVLGTNAVAHGHTALTLTTRHGLEKASLALIDAAVASGNRGTLDAATAARDTPLTLAAAHVNLEPVCLSLLHYGVDTDAVGSDGATAMDLARRNFLDVVCEELEQRRAAT